MREPKVQVENSGSEPSSPISAIHFTPWTELSGAQRGLLALVGEQAKRQPTCVLAFRESRVTDCAREQGANVVVLNCDTLAPEGSSESEAEKRLVRDLARAVGAKILHCHSAYGMRWMWRLAAAADLRLVCHHRDNFLWDDFHRDLDRAERIIAISMSVFRTLPPELQRKTSVVYNGVRIPERRPSEGRIRIGMAGRSVPEKGMHLFLDAVLPLMGRYHFDVSLWGLWSHQDAGVSQSIIERVERLDDALRTRIQLHRFREDIEEFLGSTDVVVVPSLYPEPFGRIAIEAMAWGCVTIVAGHGGLLEIVDDKVTGLVFEPGDAASLRSALETALNDRYLRADISLNGLARVREKFSLDTHYEKVQSVYAGLFT